MKTEIRLAKRKDLKRIVQVYQEAYSSEPYNEVWETKNLTRKLRESWRSLDIFVLEIDKSIEGFVMGEIYRWHDGLRGHIEDFGITKQYQGQKLGGQLLDKIEKHLKRKGANSIVLEVNEKASAERFYKRNGYKSSGYIQMEKKIQ
jgi:ribosomal protein S18 acetylase RimI-like enzyme